MTAEYVYQAPGPVDGNIYITLGRYMKWSIGKYERCNMGEKYACINKHVLPIINSRNPDKKKCIINNFYRNKLRGKDEP